MNKVSRIALGVLAISSLLTSCQEKPNEGPTPTPNPPTVELNLTSSTRTSAEFTISTDVAADYAYAFVNEKDGKVIANAEELFEQGTSDMFVENTVSLSSNELEGGNKYKLYAATRKINPFVYSELVSVDIDTDLPYEELITLDKIGLTDYTYHIEVPNDPSKIYKHISVSKADYEAIKKIYQESGMGDMTYASYLGAFGHKVTESSNITVDKYAETSFGDAIHVYSDTEYILICGYAPAENEYAIDEASTKTVFFKTKKPGKTPYKIDVKVSGIESMSATVTITPEEGITEYRAFVAATEEFDFIAFEGESSVKSMIIGAWDDQKNIEAGMGQRKFTAAASFKPSGLRPLKSYTVGIVGFDKERREVMSLTKFSTTEPTGPKPELTLREIKTATPWINTSFNIKATHTAAGYICLASKADFDAVLKDGKVTLEQLVVNNGTPMTAEEIAAITTAEGYTSTTGDLVPDSEFSLGVYVANEEGVGACKRLDFKTEKMPQIGGEIRANMPGEYTAQTKDENGATVTFPVTIATGVNDATTKDYASRNRLVVLGFAKQNEYPYTSPSEMLAKGWAKDQTEADLKYGPKFFIEFQADGSITTSKPAGYALDFEMGFINNMKLGFCGYYKNERGRWIDTTDPVFPITVSPDGNTITIEAYKTESWDGSILSYYPGMLDSSKYRDNKIFAATAPIVLTRKANRAKADASVKLLEGLKVYETIEIEVDALNLIDSRNITVEKMNR